jgi:protein-tyrosine phosphatase
MADRGIDLSEHRSTQVSAELVAKFDLILTMERRHARELVVMFGPDLPVFTVKMFARGAAVLDRSSIADLVASRDIDAFTGDSREEDVVDPIGNPASAHRAMVTEVEALCAGLTSALRASPR